jgi:hypothetical protein
MLSLLESKKGDLPDMLVFIIVAFILAIGFFILAFVTPAIADGLNIAGMNNSPEGQDAIEELADLGTVTIQRGFLFLFFGLAISTLITSFFTRVHPMFLFLYILFLGITLFVGTYLGNAYEQVTANPVLAETLASQGMITAIMQNIVMITLVIGALSMIIVFAKFSSFFNFSGGQGGQL